MTVDVATFAGTGQRGDVTFRTERSGVIHGFALGFTATLAPGLTVSNAWCGADSWARGVLPLEEPANVEAGATVSLSLETGNGSRWRWSGTIESDRQVAFDQTTILSRPPCSLTKQPL